MAKKVTLTITVNDKKAPNDLGIGIIAKRDGKMIGYSNLTAWGTIKEVMKALNLENEDIAHITVDVK